MVDMLVKYDAEEVLEEGKSILCQRRVVPSNCPSPACLSLAEVRLGVQQIRVRLDANPPELPAKTVVQRYSIHPVCLKGCGINGNRNRVFVIRQDASSGEILSAEGRWKAEIS